MEDQTERWQLRSGTWYRDPASERWRLRTAPNGTAASGRLSTQDIGRLVAAKRDAANGQWYPPDFSYSPQTGRPLWGTSSFLDAPWVPPFGAPSLTDIAAPSASGLRQTRAPLALARSNTGFDPANEPDRTLPALAPGHYRFLVHKLDAASPSLMALEPERGNLLVLLPESRTWMPLEGSATMLAAGLKDRRGWRMEVVEEPRCATLYLPTAAGLAAITPSVIGLSYAVEYFGDGPALGGAVAWAGAVWLPVLGKDGLVNLVGKPPGAAQPIVLPASAPAPSRGFEGPVLDSLQVIWPGDEGQLVVRLDQGGNKAADWIAWPEGLKPAFALGCPYLSPSGSFWQLCWRGSNRAFEYVRMGERSPQTAAVDGPRLGTGHISYKQDQRIAGDPWSTPDQLVDEAGGEVFVPLIESLVDRTVVGLRIEAPRGILALLASGKEKHRAVLQLQAGNGADILFGTLSVTRPWLASVFVYDAHLWVCHPELPQAHGWKLESC